MKYFTLAVLLFISFNNCGQYDKYVLKTGTYGCYLDISTYKELTLNEDSTFKFVDRGFTGISDIYHGKWKVRKRKLILYDYEKKVRPIRFEDNWDCWKIKGTKIISRKGLGLEFQKGL
jgi:hypothetical protein